MFECPEDTTWGSWDRRGWGWHVYWRGRCRQRRYGHRGWGRGHCASLRVSHYGRMCLASKLCPVRWLSNILSCLKHLLTMHPNGYIRVFYLSFVHWLYYQTVVYHRTTAVCKLQKLLQQNYTFKNCNNHLKVICVLNSILTSSILSILRIIKLTWIFVGPSFVSEELAGRILAS